MANSNNSLNKFDNLLTNSDKLNFRIICEAYIFDDNNRIFAQKRSSNRLKHPNSWNVVGGHLESGESLSECICREVLEETGWEILVIVDLLEIIEFDLPIEMLENGEKSSEKVFKFLVKVKELKEPILESEKVSEYRWFDKQNAEITTQNRTEKQGINYVMNGIIKAVDYLEKTGKKINF